METTATTTTMPIQNSLEENDYSNDDTIRQQQQQSPQKPQHDKTAVYESNSTLSTAVESVESSSDEEASTARLTARRADDSNDENVGNTSTGTVRFSARIKFMQVPSHRTYTPEERMDCWYSREEKEALTAKREKVVARLEAGKPEKPSRPYRGLDPWTEGGCEKTEAVVDKVINAVCDEQEDQWLSDITNEERIAEISRAISAPGVEEALLIAEQDTREVLLMMQQEKNNVEDDLISAASTVLTRKARRKSIHKHKEGQERRRRKGDKKKKKKQQDKKKKSRRAKSSQDPPGTVASQHAQDFCSEPIILQQF